MIKRRFLIALALSLLSCQSAVPKNLQVYNPSHRLLFVAIMGSSEQIAYLNQPDVATLAVGFQYVPLQLSCPFNLVEDRRYWEQHYAQLSFEQYMKQRSCALSDRDWELVNELAVTSTPEFRIYSADGRRLLSSMSGDADDAKTIAQLRQFLVSAARR